MQPRGMGQPTLTETWVHTVAPPKLTAARSTVYVAMVIKLRPGLRLRRHRHGPHFSSIPARPRHFHRDQQ